MHLKPLQDYIDEYDRETVQICRKNERARMQGSENTEAPGHLDQPFRKLVQHLMEYFNPTAGERWVNKKKIIEERMQRDRARDALFSTAEAPENIRCLVCRTEMNLVLKEIYDAADGEHEAERVLFFFHCPQGCKSRRAFFDNGEEFRPKPTQCSKCRMETVSTTTREGEKLVITEKCPQCGHTEEMRFDTVVKAPEPDPDFMKDYQRFCLTDEQGKEYLEKKSKWESDVRAGKVREEETERKKLLEKVSKIQKLSISDMEKFLASTLEKEGHGRLHLGIPEVRRTIIVPFTFQSMKEGGAEFKMVRELQRVIIAALVPTNWRLMSDGIFDQLGILSGRLRGYDREHELIELVQKKEKKRATADQH